MTKLTPLHNNVVLIKREDFGEKKFGSILVANIGDDKNTVGEIVAVGPGAYTSEGILIPMQVQVGQLAVFPTFGASKFQADNVDYIMCKEVDLIAIYSQTED